MTDRYRKLTRAIPTGKVTVPMVATISLEHWIVTHEIPSTVQSDNSSKFVSKFFAALSVSSGTRLVSTTDYHSQCKEQVGRYNKILVAHPPDNTDELQTEENLFIQRIAYRYSSQVHCATRTSPSSLILNRDPSRTLDTQKSTADGTKHLSLS